MAFLTKLTEPSQSRSWEGSIPVQFRYTAGTAGEAFLRKLKEEGRIYGTRCRTCAYTYVPARAFCERCLGELTEWVDVGTEGELFSYTIVHQDLDGNPISTPRVFGLIKFYYADSLFYHQVLSPPDQLRIGMKLVAAFRPESSRKGSILDIQGFKPKHPHRR